jgi:hypothetical protein
MEPDRIEPEFSDIIAILNVDMDWLVVVTRVKEKTIGINTQNCRHFSSVVAIVNE